MKLSRLISTTVLLVLFATCCFAQGHDTTTIATSINMHAPDDDFNMFLLVFAVSILSFTLGMALVGAGLSVFLLTIAAALIGMGILSLSILVGVLKKSMSAGIKTLLYIGCSLTGAAAGAFGFWMMALLFRLQLTSISALLAGMLAGLLGGLAWARISIFMVRKANRHFERLLMSEQRR